jgi:hypothetical protein
MGMHHQSKLTRAGTGYLTRLGANGAALAQAVVSRLMGKMLGRVFRCAGNVAG